MIFPVSLPASVPQPYRGDFERALDLIENASYRGETTVDQMFAAIHSCFSPQTQALYSKKVLHFEHTAQTEIQRRVEQAAGLIHTPRPDLPPYLALRVSHMCLWKPEEIFNETDLEQFFEQTQRRVDGFVGQWRQQVYPGLDEEVERIQHAVRDWIENRRAHAHKVFLEFQEMRPLVPVRDRLLSLDRMQRLLLAKEVLVGTDASTREWLFSQEVSSDFFSLLEKAPLDGIVVSHCAAFVIEQRSFFPITKLIQLCALTIENSESLSLIEKTFDVTFEQTLATTPLSILLRKSLRAWQKRMAPLVNQAMDFCDWPWITRVFSQPPSPLHAVAALQTLPPSQRNALKSADEMMFHVIDGLLQEDPSPGGLFHSLEMAASVCLHTQHHVPKAAVPSALIYARKLLGRFNKSPFDVCLALLQLTPHQIDLLFSRNPGKKEESLGQALVYLVLGGQLERFFPIADLWATLVTQKIASPQIIVFLNNLSDEELSHLRFLSALPGFTSKIPVSDNDFRETRLFLQNRPRLDFLRRVVVPGIPGDLELCGRLFSWFQRPTYLRQQFIEIFFTRFERLTPDERRILAAHLTPIGISPLYFCFSEGSAQFERDLSSVPLSSVPIEPLIRYIESKPFGYVRSWLQQPFQGTSRLATLSDKQKATILNRFSQHNQHLPLPEWADLFGIAADQAKEICTREESRFDQDQEEAHRKKYGQIDVNDPKSLFSIHGFGSKGIVHLLIEARTSRACGGQWSLLWGNVGPESPCAASDTVALQLSGEEGAIFPLYPRTLFTDYWYGFPAYTLRERLIALFEGANGLRISAAVCEELPSSCKSTEELEVWYELFRLKSLLREQYPFFKDPGAGNAFLPLLRENYRFESDSFERYDRNNPAHRYACTFAALLKLARKASVTHEEPFTQVLLSTDHHRDSFFQLKDRPSTKALHYFCYTVSAITPMLGRESGITPSDFEAFVSTIQRLPKDQWKALRHSTKFLYSVDDLDPPTSARYFQAWMESSPRGVNIDPASRVLIGLAEKYMPVLDRFSYMQPGATYPLDSSDPDAFCPRTRVPDFIYSQGNFASALCASFDPIEPELSDGNCGPNSFLMGLPGAEAYADERASLLDDIAEFRIDVVAYAAQHRAELVERFGEDEIDNLVGNYTVAGWSGPEVWWIAAQLYGRPVHIYNADRRKCFTLDGQGSVLPETVFSPLEPTGASPIRLMLWDVHYCLLTPREGP